MSQTCRTYVAALAVFVVGVVVVAYNFDTMRPWFYIGNGICAASVVAGFLAATTNRRQSIDEAFEAGYAAGYKRGRRVGQPTVLHFPQEVSHGGLSKAPLGEVAGERADARWAAPHPH
jgi:hypothetical protein